MCREVAGNNRTYGTGKWQYSCGTVFDKDAAERSFREKADVGYCKCKGAVGAARRVDF